MIFRRVGSSGLRLVKPGSVNAMISSSSFSQSLHRLRFAAASHSDRPEVLPLLFSLPDEQLAASHPCSPPSSRTQPASPASLENRCPFYATSLLPRHHRILEMMRINRQRIEHAIQVFARQILIKHIIHHRHRRVPARSQALQLNKREFS